MESLNLVTRERSKKDERVVSVSLTPVGRCVFESLRGERQKDLSILFNSLRESEKHQLFALLEKGAFAWKIGRSSGYYGRPNSGFQRQIERQEEEKCVGQVLPSFERNRSN